MVITTINPSCCGYKPTQLSWGPHIAWSYNQLCFGDATKQDWNISKHGMMMMMRMMMMMIGTTKPEQPAANTLDVALQQEQ